MRQYFRKVNDCIEHVDPHLCNNSGLVARLVDWEEAWEVGARYVRSAPLLDAVCDLVAEMKAAQQLVPELTTMCEDCDVELFMVLPRIVMLCFLADPLSRRTELVRSLLPHRFSPPSEGNMGAAFMKVDPELKALYDRFRDTMQLLTGCAKSSRMPQAPRGVAWEALMKQAILGTEDQVSPEHRASVADLLRAVERWSLELQRHCPEDWNQCSACWCIACWGHRRRLRLSFRCRIPLMARLWQASFNFAWARRRCLSFVAVMQASEASEACRHRGFVP